MDTAAFEHTISRIPGIETARVVMSGAHPAEIHVLALPGKPAKQVVRDVQSVALAAFGTEIDRRIVSVVQIEQADLTGGDRPAIDDVGEQIDGSRMTATVRLRWHDAVLSGSATGPAASSTRLGLVADATVAALEQALEDQVALKVSAVSTPTVGSREVAVATVVMVTGQREMTLVGSALVESDPTRAVVRAVLDAVNRHVPALRR